MNGQLKHKDKRDVLSATAVGPIVEEAVVWEHFSGKYFMDRKEHPLSVVQTFLLHWPIS
jgi:hypothetical protein